MSSPTSRSLEWLRERGWIANVVEQTIHMPGRPWGNKRDLWGFVDIAAIRTSGALVFVQVTSTGNLRARVAKAKAVAPEVLQALTLMPNAHVEFHGWSKRGPRGKRKTWQIRRLDHTGLEIP